MKENASAAVNSDEIDLVELLSKAVITLKKNLVALIFAFIIGCALGLAYYQFTPNIYESRLLITSDILTESYSKALVDNLEKLMRESNHSVLASKLKLSVSQASSISKIEIKNTIEKNDNLKEEEKNYLSIICQSSDNSIWSDLQAGLIYFLEGNNYANIRVEQKRKFISQVIEKIDKELESLTELKNKITNGLLSSTGKDNMMLFDPTTVNSKIIELSKERLNLQNSLETVNSIQVVEGFTVFTKPIAPKLSVSLAAGSSFGLFFVLLLIAFKSIKRIVQLSEEKLAKS